MKVRFVGVVASQILAQDLDACLLGQTSRGIYIRAGTNWVLYLSGEAFRGPLTLNLDEMPGSLREEAGNRVIIREGSIWFPISEIRIAFGGAEQWHPSLPAGRVLPRPEMLARLEEVSGLVHSQDDLMDVETRRALLQALQDRQVERAAGLINSFLGCGPGLTPAGDDLAAGLLLALNRWKDFIYPGSSLEILNSLFIQEARARTTSLSTNLIECAARGQADERLIRGLDGLVTGGIGTSNCADCFNHWGSTSGGAAFLGMKLALNAMP